MAWLVNSTARLPVYYVFTKRHINIDHCADTFTDHLQNDSAALADVEQILLRGDNAYEHKMRQSTLRHHSNRARG